MHLSTVLVFLVLALFLVLLHVEEGNSLYPYAIRGLVADVRHNPLRFIGGLFFKKAFLLKKLKLKWKLKKKFVLKKLLKKLFLGWKFGLKLSTKALIPQIFAQYWGYKQPFYWGGWSGGGWHQREIYIPPVFHHQHHHRHHFIPVDVQNGPSSKSVLFRLTSGTVGRKRRAVRFPDEESGSLNFRSGSSTSFPGPINISQQQHTTSISSSSTPSESSRAFFDDDSFSEFQSIGLGQHELELLRQLPENLQYEYKQEMQELETSSSEPKEEVIMDYLSATTEFDTDHCIAKGICEVMARGNRTSNQFENLLLDYYNEEPETRKDPNGAYVYDYAAFLGKSSRNLRACANYFPKCPEPTHQLTSFMNEIFTSEMCDPPVTNELHG